MIPVCDKRYHIYNRFRHFWAEIKKLWNYPLQEGECIVYTWFGNENNLKVHLSSCYKLTS